MLSRPTDEFDFAQNCESALRIHRISGSSILMWTIIAFAVGFVIWAANSEIDEMTRGEGKVIPSSAVHVIQSLDGGILAELNVAEGDTVTQGQVLLRIDDTVYASQFQENLAQKGVLEARLVRLMVETGKADTLEFSQQLLEQRPDLAEREEEVYETRKQALDDKLDSLQTRLDLANEEFDLKKPLVERNSIPRSEIIELQREIAEIEGSIRDTKNQYRSAAFEAYDQTKAQLEFLLESIKAYEVRVSRTVMKSPIDGTINAVHKKTVGSVIGAGQDILEIVPNDETLLIEALIRPSDRAFLRPGQNAVVKVTAYDFAMYGGLDGELETISADTVLQEETGQRLYQIKVRTDENGLDHKGESLPILPGMVVEVDIKTGQRTVLQYLLKPFNRAKGRALTER